VTNTLAYYDTEIITAVKGIIVMAPVLITNLDHGRSDWQWQNTLAYYDTEIITTVKIFIVLAPVLIANLDHGRNDCHWQTL
jgi:hypothetical protein